MTRDEAMKVWANAADAHATAFHESFSEDPLAELAQATQDKANLAAATVIQQAFAERDGEMRKRNGIDQFKALAMSLEELTPDELAYVRLLPEADMLRQALAAKGDSRD